MTKDTILVVGASGQIGTELVIQLRSIYGNSSVVASDLKSATKEVMEGGPFEKLDIMDESRLHEVMKKELDIARLGDSVLENIDLQNGDSLKLAEIMRPDVIYFDPVFDLKKKATAKQPMELLRSIASNKNSQDYIEQFLDCCSERLIYKRHKKQKSIFQKFITFSVTGKSVAFDVYQK